MRLLLDTHALLWFYLGDDRLSGPAQAAIVDPDNIKLISPASDQEIAIKLSLVKYALNVPYDEFIREAVYDNGFEILPIEPRHTSALVGLPRHHNDPFDRLLIVQAVIESISIVSVDAIFAAHTVSRVW
ncbi:type II toxin-antitoxin system VapC family toxin [Singulisphaera sp. Ch08]|uniref:Type II toxin-antitoxin system VapC family toxin n=1 Tax=Singulisphaera sp. Ch08 TaxID=3120278 RepID=A0AAU7CJ27_9BACT